MKIKEVFGQYRMVGLVGERNSGKTNNLMQLIKDFRETNKKTKIYFYGIDDVTTDWILKIENTFEVSSLEQLSNKKDVLIILDEFQQLQLNDRRHKDTLNKFSDFIYHKNNWVIFSSPNIREFNSIIGGKIERWILKSVRLSSIINGSQLKEAVLNYHGRYKSINNIDIPKNKLLVINEHFEKIIELDYIKEIDTKKKHISIFK